jgi:peroxiredoxin
MNTTTHAYLIQCVALALAGCESTSAEPHMTSAATTATTAPMAAGPTSTAPPAAMPEKAPPPPTLSETPADKLGLVEAGFGLKVGSKAPDATLPDVTGKVATLSALYHARPTFVVFYRGGWCPFCNMQLHALTAAKPDFDKKGLALVAISVDKPEEEAKTQAKHGVPFPMLSDSDLATHKAFNVVHVPPEAEAKAMAGYGIDLEKYSGRTHHNFAVPAIFLVDRTGVIRWAHVDEDFKTRPSPKQMLDVADRILVK